MRLVEVEDAEGRPEARLVARLEQPLPRAARAAPDPSRRPAHACKSEHRAFALAVARLSDPRGWVGVGGLGERGGQAPVPRPVPRCLRAARRRGATDVRDAPGASRCVLGPYAPACGGCPSLCHEASSLSTAAHPSSLRGAVSYYRRRRQSRRAVADLELVHADDGVAQHVDRQPDDLPPPPPSPSTRAPTHTRTHARMHAQKHARKHAHTHKYKLARTSAHTHAPMICGRARVAPRAPRRRQSDRRVLRRQQTGGGGGSTLSPASLAREICPIDPQLIKIILVF